MSDDRWFACAKCRAVGHYVQMPGGALGLEPRDYAAHWHNTGDDLRLGFRSEGEARRWIMRRRSPTARQLRYRGWLQDGSLQGKGFAPEARIEYPPTQTCFLGRLP